jgi:hypothetical protein
MNPIFKIFVKRIDNNNKEIWLPLIRYYIEPKYTELFDILNIEPVIRIETRDNKNKLIQIELKN